MRHIYLTLAFIGFSTLASAQDPNLKVTAEFTPADAKPGQTVTLKIKVDIDPTWHTYPTVQPEKAAASFANKITFPEKGPLIQVDTLKEPKDPLVKPEPDLGIQKLHTYPGGGTWEQTMVVAPNAKTGELTTSIKFRISICNDKGCLPPKTVEVKPSLKVAGAPVPVDLKYKEAVDKIK